jgi:glutathione S-transferase
MADFTLITANKNYCLWPLPAWLSLKIAELEFDEITIPFGHPDARQLFEEHSPSGWVPALKHGDLTLWESLAICEYVAELAPNAGLWPDDRERRALARAVASEMYSGYKSVLSRVMPTNVRRRTGPLDVPEELQKIIDHNTQIWRDCRAKYAGDGPYLFGGFSIADAFHAPLVNRFVSYNVPLGPVESEYRDAVRSHPKVMEFVALAEAEPWDYEPSDRPFAV